LIYLDTSVFLAQLLAEDRFPPDEFWRQPLVASRLLEYEIWTRLHGAKLAGSHGEQARALLARLSFVELVTPVLARALEPFPKPVRTLDALHLASAHFLGSRDPSLALATYDAKLADAANAMGLPTLEP